MSQLPEGRMMLVMALHIYKTAHEFSKLWHRAPQDVFVEVACLLGSGKYY